MIHFFPCKLCWAVPSPGTSFPKSALIKISASSAFCNKFQRACSLETSGYRSQSCPFTAQGPSSGLWCCGQGQRQESGPSVCKGSPPTKSLAIWSGSRVGFKITYCNKDLILKAFSSEVNQILIVRKMARLSSLLYELQNADRVDGLRIFHAVNATAGANQTYYHRQMCAVNHVYIEFPFKINFFLISFHFHV